MGLFSKKRCEYPKEFKDIYVVSGLNIKAEVPCSVVATNDTVSIICAEQEFVLRISNIIDFQYKMDVDIESDIQNGSILKGIIGGIAFGLPGAIVGSLPRTKKKRLVTGSVLLRYQGKDDIKTIILISAPNTLGCAALADDLKPRVSIKRDVVKTEKIEL